MDLLTVKCSQLPYTAWSLLLNTGLGILFLKGIDTGCDTAHFSVWLLTYAVGERFILHGAVQNRRSIKTSKKNSTRRHVRSWGFCQEICLSIHKTVWDVPGTHRSDALFCHCHAPLQQGEWCSVQISIKCCALQQAWNLHRLNAGKGRAEKGTSLGSSRAA